MTEEDMVAYHLPKGNPLRDWKQRKLDEESMPMATVKEQRVSRKEKEVKEKKAPAKKVEKKIQKKKSEAKK